MTNKNIIILGIGGGASKIISKMNSINSMLNIKFVAIDTDQEFLQKLPNSISKLAIGGTITNNEGCGGNPQKGETAANNSIHKIREELKQADVIIIVTCLGKGAGSGIIKVVGKIISQQKCPTICLFTTPFSHEGNKRTKIATEIITQLQKKIEALIIIPNDLLFNVEEININAKSAFELANNTLAQALIKITQILSTDGIMNADFASFKEVLGDNNTICSIGIGTGEGENHCQKALEAFYKCPLIGNKKNLKDADAAIVTIHGSKNLAIDDITLVFNNLKKMFQENINIIHGIYTYDNLKEETTIAALLCKYTKQNQLLKTASPTKLIHVQNNTPHKSPELLLVSQELGIFANNGDPTNVNGVNLDIPPFQRDAIHITVEPKK